MKNTVKHIAIVFSAALALGALATSAFAQVNGYVQAPVSGVTVKDPFGLCWRTGYWTPAMATTECDPELVPKKAAPAPAAVVTPPPAPMPKHEVRPIVEKVTMAAETNFDFNKAVLKPEGKAKLDDLVSKLKAVNVEVIIAVGHTDSIGSVAYNLKLSLRRANAVKAYLVSKGVEADRIYTEGKGKSQPIASNRTKEGRAKNRRVEIEVVGTQQR
jgi:OmpA-OmpF porin, OOP family